VKQRDSNESAAACALAVPAMAIEHCERCLDALITYGATSAPTLKWNRNRRRGHLSTHAMSDGPSRTQRTYFALRFASLFAPLRKSNVSGPNGRPQWQFAGKTSRERTNPGDQTPGNLGVRGVSGFVSHRCSLPSASQVSGPEVFFGAAMALLDRSRYAIACGVVQTRKLPAQYRRVRLRVRGG
jgi:hypothetical protein